MKRIKFYSLLCLVALYLVIQSGCKKKDDSGAPALPPSASMDMEGLSNFASKKKSISLSTDSSNFKAAWKFVHSWDSITIKFLLVPKLIFIEALTGKEPVYDNTNEQWTWTYNKAINGNGNYQSVLTGKVSKDSMYWTMTVSLIGGDGLTNFMWFEGKTDLNQTGGWWKLYEPITKKAYLLITWDKKSEATKSIKYTNIFDLALDKGTYIKYGLSTKADYNAYFDIFCTFPQATAKIEWNTTTYAGQITYSGYIFGWDSALHNLTTKPAN